MSNEPISETKNETKLFLLSPTDRVLSFQKIGQLAILSKLANDKNDWIPSGLAFNALCCADAYLAENTSKPWQKKDFKYITLSNGTACSNVLVVATSNTSEGFHNICAVADLLGAGCFQPLDEKKLAEFLELLEQASNIVLALPEYREIILKNTGVIVPFLCKPPAVGSGSILQIPGALLLPADVPPVVLAECWIHEALHTELYLAEWLEGKPPACARENLQTPWRTVKRPASLLLHGAYVFSSLLKFMRDMNMEYNLVPSHWNLSATRGTQVLIANVEETINFRKNQIVEAMKCLKSNASFSTYGKKTEYIILKNLFDNGVIIDSL